MEDKKMLRVSFRLEEDYKELLAKLAKRGRRSMTDHIRLLLDKDAVEQGLDPVVKTDVEQPQLN